MDTLTTITIFFVGIAAFVNSTPPDTVLKHVIFPAARSGSYYRMTELVPHKTFLYLRGMDFYRDSKTPYDPKDAEPACVNTYQGKWSTVGPYEICTIELNGAKVWTRTSEALIETESFRKIPSFSSSCDTARNLPPRYTASPVDPDLVAAHVNITGGVASGCNRTAGAFVTQLDVVTNDATLYVEQDQRTLRIVLNDGARVAIENKPDADPSHTNHDPATHYGWYNFINAERINCPIATWVNPVAGMAECQNIPGVEENVTSSVTGAECSNSNYP